MNPLKITAPACIRADIALPSSKSISNRALIISALAGNTCPQPQRLSDCDDTRVMTRALTEGGDTIDIMAAGTAMRFLTAYLAVTPGQRILTGTERMQQRPIGVLVDALRQLGADIAYTSREGFPPLCITGRQLSGHALSLPGHISSQYISALLMIAPVLPGGLTLTLTGDIVSRPYIDMTLRLMNDFGARAAWVDERQLHVEPVPYRPTPFSVESDWSAASYWYEMVALCPSAEAEVILPGLLSDSLQGDSKVAELFRPLGVETLYGHHVVTLRKTARQATRMDYDFTAQPDLAQTFVVTCAMLGVPFRFSGLQSLKIKETDRMAALICEMAKLGYVLTETDGSVLTWDGKRGEAMADVAIDTYEDHRMAMAFAPASLVRGSILIREPQVVSKSYPHYWDDLRQAGFTLEEEA